MRSGLWKENRMDEIIKKEKEFVEEVNLAIVFLNNHHYNTKNLIKLTKEYLELTQISQLKKE